MKDILKTEWSVPSIYAFVWERWKLFGSILIKRNITKVRKKINNLVFLFSFLLACRRLCHSGLKMFFLGFFLIFFLIFIFVCFCVVSFFESIVHSLSCTNRHKRSRFSSLLVTLRCWSWKSAVSKKKEAKATNSTQISAPIRNPK